MTTTNGSPSSTSSATMSSSSEANNPGRNPIPNPNPNPGSSSSNTMQSWWESVSKAQSRIHALSSLLASPNLITLAESDRPARSLLNSSEAYLAVSAALSHTSSGSGDDPLCQWLYETYQSSDPDLRLVVLSFVPLLSGLYLSRVVTFSVSSASGSAPSLAGFEAVLLALYGSEVKARSGKPLLITVQDPSQPSLYHTPPKGSASSHKPTIGVLSPPLEPQVAVKSTKRACIVGIALDCYYKKISLMPPCSKIDLCEFVSSWAGQDCPCRYEFDDDVDFSSVPENSGEDDGGFENASEEMGKLSIQDRLNRECNWEGDESTSRRGSRVPLPWELLQPVLRILGHCLLAPLIPQEVRDSASAAVRCVYARASHDITPQVILAARSLIQLDKSTRKNAKDALMFAAPGPTSNPSTPNKPRKPEVTYLKEIILVYDVKMHLVLRGGY
ncbi:uncharacterized protein LOC110030539 isoform X2 [Phalaenopsis equestris]|uniref:uncharacterized protein LOC110030539 isoform X2 n=1 Tax=Phalaenopsis equestris TaxID=78828 RepID=UPI0009E41547|nr:uncharacterized protein LOC110030539 isoform X2 [Phalaenopsis equestris]